MKRHEIAATYEKRLAVVRRKHEHLTRQRQTFVTDVYRIRTHPKLTHSRRKHALQSYLRGRPYEQWLAYYDDHINTLTSEAYEYQQLVHENTVPEPKTWIAPAAIVVLVLVLTASVFVLGPGITSFAIVEQPTTKPILERAVIIDTPPVNLSEINSSRGVHAQR